MANSQAESAEPNSPARHACCQPLRKHEKKSNFFRRSRDRCHFFPFIFRVWPAIQIISRMSVALAIRYAVPRLLIFLLVILSRFSCCLHRRSRADCNCHSHYSREAEAAKPKRQRSRCNLQGQSRANKAPKLKSRSRSRGPEAAKPKPKRQIRRTETAKCNNRLAASCFERVH